MSRRIDKHVLLNNESTLAEGDSFSSHPWSRAIIAVFPNLRSPHHDQCKGKPNPSTEYNALPVRGWRQAVHVWKMNNGIFSKSNHATVNIPRSTLVVWGERGAPQGPNPCVDVGRGTVSGLFVAAVGRRKKEGDRQRIGDFAPVSAQAG